MVCEFYYELFKHWHLRPGVNPESLPIVLNLDDSDDEGQDFSTLFVIKDEYQEPSPQRSASPAQASIHMTPQVAVHMEDSGAAAGEVEGQDLAENTEKEEGLEGRVEEEQTLGDGFGDVEVNPSPVEVIPQSVEAIPENTLEVSEPAMDGTEENEVFDPYPEPEPDTPSETETAAVASAPELDPMHDTRQQACPLETMSSDDVEQRIAKLKFLASMF